MTIKRYQVIWQHADTSKADRTSFSNILHYEYKYAKEESLSRSKSDPINRYGVIIVNINPKGVWLLT